jgi:hypothetical protein
MLPGGFKGLRFLHEHHLTPRLNITSKSAMPPSPKMPKPNMRAAAAGSQEYQTCCCPTELWLDDEFYLMVLAGRSDVLTRLAKVSSAFPSPRSR